MTTSDKFQRHSFKLTFKLKVKSVIGRLFTFDIFEKKNILLVQAHMRISASEPEPEPEPSEPVHFARSRSRSRSRRKVLLGAGAGAGAGMLPWSRSRSRSRPKMSRLRTPGCSTIVKNGNLGIFDPWRPQFLTFRKLD